MHGLFAGFVVDLAGPGSISVHAIALNFVGIFNRMYTAFRHPSRLFLLNKVRGGADRMKF